MEADQIAVEQSSLETAARPLRVLVADDDALFRNVVRDILTRAGIRVVAEASNGRDALRMARHYKPDVVVLDVVMPSMDGLTALEQMINDTDIESRVLMVSVYADNDVAFVALRKGALGYLDKENDLVSLPRILGEVATGCAALSPSLTTHLLQRLRELPEGGIGMRPIQSVLTAREWEVADLLSLSQTTDDIAETLVLSTETVRTHIRNIMRKLGVHRRIDLIETVERLRCGLVLDNVRPGEPVEPILSRSAA